MLSFRLALYSFLLVFAVSAYAEPYFPAEQIPATSIEAPPATDSEIWKNDVDHIVDLQKNPDATELKNAATERDMSPEMMTKDIDPALTRETYPAVFTFLDRVGETSKAVTHQAKDHWNTRRPYLMDKRIKALIDAHDNPAYPSGHTSGSFTWAYVLGLLQPQNADKYLARAESIAQHRVLVGMHYPHDVEGGKKLAQLIFESLQENDDFQKDLKAAKRALSPKP